MRAPQGQTNIEKPNRAYRLPFLVLIVLLFGASTFLIASKNPETVTNIRSSFADYIASFAENIDLLNQKASDALFMVTHFTQREENIATLKEENRALQKWRHIALKLNAENDSLKKLLQFVPEDQYDFITARCLTFSKDTQKIATLNVGLKDDVKKGDIVLGGQGVIGRISSVNQASCEFLLIHDAFSKVPVQVEGKEISALVAGDYVGNLKLLYVKHDSPLTVGDRLLTSNEGGVFPAGFFVGTVKEIQNDNVLVESPENLSRLGFVMVLRQGLDES